MSKHSTTFEMVLRTVYIYITTFCSRQPAWPLFFFPCKTPVDVSLLSVHAPRNRTRIECFDGLEEAALWRFFFFFFFSSTAFRSNISSTTHTTVAWATQPVGFSFLTCLDLEGASRKTRETADRSPPNGFPGCRTGMHHAAWNIDRASAW